MKDLRLKAGLLAAAILFALTPRTAAQVTNPDTAATKEATDKGDDDVVVLSPFVVEDTDNASRYHANSTLAGTRVRTELRDVASPISVVTSLFLRDVNAHSNQDLLQYTTNTEVGGLYGNYGGFGNQQGLRENDALLRPSSNTRVRGLEQADGTRNYFLSDIPWDSYNTDRIDLQRGPNSILFGVGSPAGIINASTIVAKLGKDEGNIQNELSSYGSVRFSLDFNKVLIKDELALRIAALDSDRKFRQKPAFNKDRRLFGTLTYQPQILPKSWAGPTVFRANAETGKINANNPRVLPPIDAISLWFDDIAGDGVKDPWGMQRMVYDPYLLESAAFGNVGRGLNGNVLNGYYVPAYSYMDGGNVNNGSIEFFYHNGDSTPYSVSQQARRDYVGGLSPNGTIDGTITGISYTTLMRGAAWNNYAYNINLLDKNRAAAGEISEDQIRFLYADRNYYKDRSLSDPTIYDFYNNLIDGDNKRERNDWTAYNLSLAQTLFDNRFGFEFVYDSQTYNQRRDGVAWDNPYISIDVNANLQSQFSQYSRVPDPNNPANTVVDRATYTVPGFTPTADQPYANPNAGAAFVTGGSNGNFSNKIVRETSRLTAFAELRGSDLFDRESFLAKLIGRHVFTGLATREDRNYTDASWLFAATDYSWAQSQNNTGANTKIQESFRQIVPIVYLSSPLFDQSSAHGLHLSPVTSVIDPVGQYSTQYFNTTWNHPLDPNAAGYVDPGSSVLDWFGNATTASEIPANYVGWVQKPVEILNAGQGDKSQLYTNYQVREQQVDSAGFTWQGFFANGHIVPTVGWRRDKLVTWTGAGAKDPTTGVFADHAEADTRALKNTGNTTSWGIVAHVPESWVERIPGVSGLSVYYNVGRNSKVESRYNFDGEPLPNPTAESTDYGVVLNLWKDKITIKAGHYLTKVKNGNLPGGASLIGDQQYYINQLEAWGTASALMDYFGSWGLDPNQNWYWNWVWVDQGYQDADLALDPLSDAYRNNPSTVKQRAAISDFFAGMDQQFFDNYQIPINVAKLQEAYATGNVQNVAAAVAGVFPVGSYTTGLNSTGQIKGITPNGTIDNTSKGYEIEVNFAPTDQWNVQVNASKTIAYRESLGQPMRDFIAKQYARFQGPAGDLRLWWGGDATIRQYYESNIISALTFQEEAIGSQAPELRPWRYAAVTNYNFTHGLLKGFNLGGAWRWEDRQILGYGMKDDRSGLDVHKPIYGETDSSFDLWLGYQRKIGAKFTWRSQLNLRSVGKTAHLTPISADPDGTFAAQRIVDGMTWAFSNSLLF